MLEKLWLSARYVRGARAHWKNKHWARAPSTLIIAYKLFHKIHKLFKRENLWNICCHLLPIIWGQKSLNALLLVFGRYKTLLCAGIILLVSCLLARNRVRSPHSTRKPKHSCPTESANKGRDKSHPVWRGLLLNYTIIKMATIKLHKIMLSISVFIILIL